MPKVTLHLNNKADFKSGAVRLQNLSLSHHKILPRARDTKSSFLSKNHCVFPMPCFLWPHCSCSLPHLLQPHWPLSPSQYAKHVPTPRSPTWRAPSRSLCKWHFLSGASSSYSTASNHPITLWPFSLLYLLSLNVSCSLVY